MVEPAQIPPQDERLGSAEDAVASSLQEWGRRDLVARLFAGDASLWTDGDEGRWLGWLGLPGQFDQALFRRLVADLRSADFRHVLVLGMGGSSLCPDLFRHTFGTYEGFPQLHVLDSLVPEQIHRIEREIDISRSLFVVSSKSGSTIEPNLLYQYFRHRIERLMSNHPGARFAAVTDPGSSLDKLATEEAFRFVLHGDPRVGGRFSALSPFGLAPAAMMGLDVHELISRAAAMYKMTAHTTVPTENPAVRLGVTLGTLAKLGRNKLTLVMSDSVAALGSWIEQLIAESTGKLGQGIVPVVGEDLGAPEVYGDDRLFVHVRCLDGSDGATAAAVAALSDAGHPVVRILMADQLDLGAELYRWEVATAVAGAVMGLHPFDQPDVEAAKIAARSLAETYRATGSLPAETPLVGDGALQLYAESATADLLRGARDVDHAIGLHLAQARTGDYLAIQAFLDMNPTVDRHLQRLRHWVRSTSRVATTVGYGPRFLHSTGQLHKGGDGSGLFLQITSDHPDDLAVPGDRATFGTITAAQARGDFAVLTERRRRVLRVHLSGDLSAGLERLLAACCNS